MIDMKCPACGAEGRVPSTKINTRLVCPKCLKIFHVTSAGRSVLGEPPTPSAAAVPKHAAKKPSDQAQKLDDAFRELSDTISSRNALYVLACLLVVGLIGSFFAFHKGEVVQDKADAVTKAVVQGDLQTLRGLCSAGTAEDAVKWYDAIRPQCDALRQSHESSQLIVSVMVTQQDKNEGTADVIATAFLGEGSLERKAGSLPDASVSLPTARSLSIPMTFRSEGWSGWLLDGRRTHAMPMPGTASPTPPQGQRRR